jgi:hypothetical protein
LSLFIIAASLYLPEHVVLMANRVFYYFSGDEQNLHNVNKAAQQALVSTSHVIHGAATSFLGKEAHVGGGLAGNGRGYMEA